MKAGFMVACQYAGHLEGGAPLLVGIFRRIQVAAFPAHLIPFYIAIELEAEPYEVGDYPLELRLIDQDGQSLFTQGLLSHFRPRTDMGPNYSYFSEVLHIREQVVRPGVYRLDLVCKDQVISELRLDITL